MNAWERQQTKQGGCLCVDIESRPLPPEQLDAMRPVFTAPGNYKSPEAIAKWQAEAEAEWRERAALSALTGKVVLIGALDVATGKVTQAIDGGDETETSMLDWFWRNVWPGNQIVGWNVKAFDMRFLVQRSRILNVPVPRDIMQGRYWNPRVIDLMETWECFTYGAKASLDSVARALGLEGKSGSGKDSLTMPMPELLRYNEQDLLTTAAVAKRLGIL